MRPEQNAQRTLSITRAKAKMYEYDVPLEDHINLYTRPEILFSLAVGLLGDAAAAIASNTPDDERRLTTPEALRFAGAFLDAYRDTRLGAANSQELSMLSAASYYLADNPGSSKVVVGHVQRPPPEDGGGLARLTYQLLRGEFAPLPEVAAYREVGNRILDALNSYMTGDAQAAAVHEAADSIRTAGYQTDDARQLLYADLAAAISRRKIASASRTILPEASNLPLATWHDTLRREGFVRELWPAQRRICAAGALGGRSVVVQMPTSAGKTRASELLLRSAFLAGRTSLAVIVGPFRALCHDIRAELTKAFVGENIRLNEATDAYQMDVAFDELLGQPTVLIVTPEKLLYMLRRRPDLAQHIGLIIYDEGHQFDGAKRGPTYELLLTSLRLSMPPETQVVLISAVISNGSRLAEWLVGSADAVVRGEGLAPTQKSIAFARWTEDLGSLEYVQPLDPDDTEFYVPRVISQIALPRLPRERAHRVFPIKDDGVSVGLYLGLKLVMHGGVAVFCGRKDTAANACGDVVDLFRRGTAFEPPSAVSDGGEVQKLASLFAGHLGETAAASGGARLGVFPHHANVPHGLRLAVESAMKEGQIRFVICTSTLAQGVNLPIRYLIVTTVYQGGDKILVRDFHNLIGRAGRAGMHTEGSIIFSDNSVYDRRHDADSRWKWRTAKQLLDPGNTEPCGSAILSIFHPFAYGLRRSQRLALTVQALHQLLFAERQEIEAFVQRQGLGPIDGPRFRRFVINRHVIVQSIASYLLAHLDLAGDNWRDEAAVLARSTFAYFSADDAQRPQIELLFQNVAQTVHDRADTEEFRTALRRSPLPPPAVNQLRAWIERNVPMLQQAVGEDRLFAVISPIMLERNQNDAINSLSNPDVAVNVAEMWIEGASFADVYALLVRRSVKIGRFKPKVEDAVEICEQGLGYDGAMIVATLADLSEGLDDDVHKALALLQRRLKYGLRSSSAIAFFEIGFADRIVAETLATEFPDVLTRGAARREIRRSRDQVQALLAPFPGYFSAVFRELAS